MALYVTTSNGPVGAAVVRASRTATGPDISARTSPSAQRPAAASDTGPRTPARTGGTRSGGRSSVTSASWTNRPCVVTVSPASSRRTAVMTSSNAVTGDGWRAPIWAIHSCTP